MGGGGGTGRALCRGCRCVGSGGGSEEDAGTRFRAKLASKRGKMRKNSFVGAKPYWPNGSSYFSCSVANKRPMDDQAKFQELPVVGGSLRGFPYPPPAAITSHNCLLRPQNRRPGRSPPPRAPILYCRSCPPSPELSLEVEGEGGA